MSALRMMVWVLILLPFATNSLGAQTENPAPPVLEIEGYDPAKDLFLVEQEKCTLLIQGLEAHEGVLLRAVYRPDSKVQAFEALDKAVTRQEWTPREPGLVKLEFYHEIEGTDPEEEVRSVGKKVVSVRFASKLPAGFFIMILAGLLLFGGAFFSIQALLRD